MIAESTATDRLALAFQTLVRDDDQQQLTRTTVAELREDPDVKAVLKAVAMAD